jgi:hypothetical protein
MPTFGLTKSSDTDSKTVTCFRAAHQIAVRYVSNGGGRFSDAVKTANGFFDKQTAQSCAEDNSV